MMRDYYAPSHARKIPGWLRASLFGIVFILLLQSLFQIPFFKIDSISISGLKYISNDEVHRFVEEEISRRRFVIFKNDNYFIFARSRLVNRLQEKLFLEVISISTDFPNTLQLVLRERIAGFVLQTPREYIAIGTKGEWIGVVSGPRESQSIIADERQEPGTTLPLEYLEVATDIQEYWRAIIPELEIEKFHLTDEQHIVIVSTVKGYRVFFSPENDIERQLQRLKVYLLETSLAQPKEYIDLRFDENLYIR